MSITVREVTKRFGKFVALDRVSLEVPTGGLVALLGPSGSGKTTLLRIIAGLELADEGSIWFRDEDITGQAPRERNVGFVFQHYALFRHMNVFENVAFGLRVRNWPAPEISKRVAELLHLIRLEGLENRLPSQLSGGQRQRIALARALAVDPKVLLLDEPFGALDAKVRNELRQWLRRLHDEIHTTSVFVTHDQDEAFEVSDTVVVMRDGRVEQCGSPQEVFDHPANAFVMDFLGNVNVFHGLVANGRFQTHARANSDDSTPGLDVFYPDYPHNHERPAVVYVRPHEFEISRRANGVPSIVAQVVHVNAAGPVVKIRLAARDDQSSIQVDLTRSRFAELDLSPGDTVFVSSKHARVFFPEGDRGSRKSQDSNAD